MAPASSQRPSRARINVCRLNAEKVVNPPHRRSVLDVASEGDITIEMAVGHAAKHELDQRGDAASRRDRNGRTT